MSLNENIDSLFSFELLKLFKIIGNLSKERNERVFLVGGIVRDLILGIVNKDIDLAVEGDGIEFAKDLKEKIKAEKIITHEKFKTAVVIVNEELKIDIATTRTEEYKYSGALPIVKYSNIREDMFRRDFTINAMALEITTDKFGELLDFYGGINDLENKRIKILHRDSFIDDPTRIIRALKFAARYDFELEKETEILLKEAIKKRVLKNISSDRFKHELKLLFSDKNLKKSISTLEKYKIFNEINRNIVYTLKIEKNIERLETMGKLLEVTKVERWVIVFLLLLDDLEEKEIIDVLKRFNFSEKFISSYIYGITERESALKKLNEISKNSEIYQILRKISSEAVILIYIQAKEKKVMEKIEQYIFISSKSRPLVNGDDLIDLGIKPGKEFKKLLENYFMKQLDLESPTKNGILKG